MKPQSITPEKMKHDLATKGKCQITVKYAREILGWKVNVNTGYVNPRKWITAVGGNRVHCPVKLLDAELVLEITMPEHKREPQ
jgi:hypothetical protein